MLQGASRPYSISVSAAPAPPPTPPSITTPSLPTGMVGSSYSASLSATGGTAPYAWSVLSGSLPPGVALSTSGMISGNPTKAGTYNFAVQISDSGSPVQTASHPYSISVSAAPPPPPSPISIITNSLPSGTVGSSYSASLNASGGTAPYAWSVLSGNLPPGIDLSSTGNFSGSPTTAGTYNFVVRLTDSSSPAQTASQTFIISINHAPSPPPSPLSIITNSLPGGTVGSSYSANFNATGGTPGYTWSIDLGSLPQDLSWA